jgi:hypothetical protein
MKLIGDSMGDGALHAHHRRPCRMRQPFDLNAANFPVIVPLLSSGCATWEDSMEQGLVQRLFSLAAVNHEIARV